MPEPAAFHPFGRDHLLTLALIVVSGALVASACKRRPPRQIRWLGRLLAIVLLGYVATVYLQKGLAKELSWEYALPLELCHLVMLACLLALIRPSPLASEISYFVGLAGTLQATLTPEIGEGFPSWEFVLFFWSHGIVLLAVVYLIASGQFKPRRGSVLRMMAFVNGYALVVGGIDACFRWNYGYLCSKPGHPSLLDYLGPWPWYIASLEAVAFVNFVLLDLPWRSLRRPNS